MKKEVSKSVINSIIGFAICLAFVSWLFICFSDYQNYKKRREPKFCIKNESVEYKNGIIKRCYGLGYKVIRYQKEDRYTIEFLPLWFDESIK